MMTDTQMQVSCPHCSYFEICEIDQKPVFFLCRNNSCAMCTCIVCNESFRLSKNLDGLSEEQIKALVQEEGSRLHMKCIGYEKYVADIIYICDKQSKRVCPSCGFIGRKDENCTHITCNNCKHQFCYVCGLSFDVADKENPNGGIFEHRVIMK